MLADDVYVFNDVVESDDEINPKSVICSEPLIVPLGVLLSETKPNAVIWAEELSNTEPVNVSKFVSWTVAEDVNAFKDEFSPPLSDTKPNAVICADELIVPSTDWDKNPKDVIWPEPLIVPLGVPLSETKPNAVICSEPLNTPNVFNLAFTSESV